jgi:hypothetical protein
MCQISQLLCDANSDRGRLDGAALSLVCSPPKRSATGPREPAHNEIVGILDHVFDHPVGYRSVDDHGVPVPFVQVVAREHSCVRVTELLCEQWFTFDADLKRGLREPGEREHLAGHNTDVSGPNGNVSAAPGNARQ